jgi:2-polyprenyl-6-methoxyphenol hydroxylase-like FAD-dependent oxidoreductase
LQRGALFALLDAAWQEARNMHCGRRIVGMDVEAGVLRDEHGVEHGAFDLLVIADGAASQLRREVGAAQMDRPYPWGAQWCLVPRRDWPFADELRQRYVGARRMAGMLPVGTRPGDDTPRMSFFWSLSAHSLDTQHDETQWRRDVADVWPDAAKRCATRPCRTAWRRRAIATPLPDAGTAAVPCCWETRHTR